MSTIPIPRQWGVGDEVTASDLNTLVAAAQWVLTSTPVATAVQTSVQSIPYETWTAITLDSVLFDTEAAFNLATDAYVVETTGWYLLTGVVNYAQGPSTSRGCSAVVRFAANGQNTIPGIGACDLVGTSSKWPPFQQLAYLSVGDYVQLQAWHNWGSDSTPAAISTAVNTTAPDAEVSGLSVMWISA